MQDLRGHAARARIGQHAAGVLVGPLAGVVLSHVPLFQGTPIAAGMTAATLARTTGHAVGLMFLWRLADQISCMVIGEDQPGRAFWAKLVKPSVLLLIVFLSHRMIVPYLLPLVGTRLQALYPWAWALASVGSGMWFTFAWLGNAGMLLTWVAGGQASEREQERRHTRSIRTDRDHTPISEKTIVITRPA